MTRKILTTIFTVIVILGLIYIFFTPGYFPMRSKAQITKCIIALDAVKTAEETYMQDKKTDLPVSVDDLLNEKYLEEKKIQNACASMEMTKSEKGGIYEFQARPQGKFANTCMLILTNTGLNTVPSLPAGCRRAY